MTNYYLAREKLECVNYKPNNEFVQQWENSLKEMYTEDPHQNDQGRKGPCCFQRLIALKCLKCQKIKKTIYS